MRILLQKEMVVTSKYGNSIGGGTIKLKRISVEGLDIDFNYGLPILEMDGAANKSEVNHFINDVNELGADIKEEMTNGR